MKRITQITGFRMLCIAAALILLLSLVPSSAYAAEHSIIISVTQIFVSSQDTADSTFTYRLKPLDKCNPMPMGSTADGYTFTISGIASSELAPIRYSRQGLYRYELFQLIQTEKSGYIYDRRIYTIEIHVHPVRGITMIVLNRDGTKAGEIVFKNAAIEHPDVPKTPAIPAWPGRLATVVNEDASKNGQAGAAPRTGDETRLPFYIVWVVLDGLFIVCVAAYRTCRRKSRFKNGHRLAS